MKKKLPLVSIIIPTKNSEEKISQFIRSVRNIRPTIPFEIVINDDLTSSPALKKVLSASNDIDIRYLQKNKSMAQGRYEGAKTAKGKVLLHLDSDMQITGGLIEDIVKKIKTYDALILPEKSIGSGYWSACKILEKSLYEGVEQVESVRAVRTEWYWKVGGHDPELVFSEDKDLDIRLRNAGAKIGRAEKYVIHDEGNVTIRDIFQKKKRYTLTAKLYKRKHSKAFSDQTSIVKRLMILLSKWKKWIKKPHLFIGIIVIKAVEYLAFIDAHD